jgi:hypothetical protein
MYGGGKAEDPSQGSTKSTEAGETTKEQAGIIKIPAHCSQLLKEGTISFLPNVTKSLVNVLTCKNHPI